jgi:choline dehydrogenase-like flavoprotein
MQVQKSEPVYDVVIIGSGAAGGMAAWNLTRQGVNVLLLDAGEKFSRSKFWSHVKPWQWTDRLDKGQHPPQFFLSTEEQPFETPPGQPFNLYRVWGRGGKTNVWGRVALRYSDIDFEGPLRDGWGIPWPIRYKDIAPYYDKVDQLIGVCGGTDDQDSLPGSKYMLPAPPPRCGERLLQKAAQQTGISIVSGRRAVLTKPHNGHPQCHFCGACGRGCDVGAFFNSSDYLLEPAMQTGKLEVIDNAVVARVLVNDRGLADGVQFFHRHTKQERRVKARIIVVAASCVDSTRILLNSKSQRYPNGIGNSSDTIGRYLCEQIRFHIYAFMPELMGGPVHDDSGIGGEHIYMPRFNHRDGRKRDYIRGYGMQFWGCGAQDAIPWAKTLPGFGPDLKKEIRRHYPALVALHPYGETIGRKENRIVIDESRTDAYGVPLFRIEYKIGENERLMAKEMYATAEQILASAKAEVLAFKRGHVDTPGEAIHEHGTCRMGDDPALSALNGFNQMHEVKNVFVVDGSAFTTASEKNPTLTILALAWRSTDYLANEMKRGNI